MVIAVILIALTVTVAAANILNKKDVTVVDGSKVYHVSTTCVTVSAVISQLGIKLQGEDVVKPALDSNLEENTKIYIKHSFAVEVVADGKTLIVQTAPATVQKILDAAGVKLNKQDKINLALDSTLTEPGKIVINRITYGKVEETVAVEPKVVRKPDNDLASGITKVLVNGKAGENSVTYQVVYKDGKPVMKTRVACVATKEVQDKVVAYGTVKTASRGGRQFEFTKVILVRSTAYTYTGHHTSRGTTPKVGTVAVDPSVIPLGSKLYIEGYGFATVLDTGGAIDGNEIDVFLENSSDCSHWGVRNTRVYILK